MKTLEFDHMELLSGGLDCDTKLGLGFGLFLGGLLLSVVTFGLGAGVAVIGYGIGKQAMTGQGCNK